MTDNITGLIWQQGEGGLMDWEAALVYCENLTLAGYSDWRLPNIKELYSIIDVTKVNPAIDTTYFPGTTSSNYWSSTTYARVRSTSYAWRVDFYDGYIYHYLKSYNYYVRCVRGGE